MPIHGFPGGVISSTQQTPSVSSASGVWTLDEQLQAGANWPVAPSFVNNSVRLRASASAYMSRTPASAGNRRTWTWSGWVKRGDLASTRVLFSSAIGTTDNTHLWIGFDGSTAKLLVQSWNGGYFHTNAVFRDPSAWYHVVVAIDTTQATAANRVRVYINNVEQSGTQPIGYPSQNADLGVNLNQAHGIGYNNYSGGSSYYDGYITDVNFIDGQALTPNYFGAIDGATGVWEPATYRGTYGTNGFYLPFNLNTTPAFGGFTGDISSSFNTLPTGSQGSNFQFTGNFTIEGWVLFPSASTGDGSFYVSSDGSGFLAFNIDVAGGVYNIYMNSGVPTAIISSDIKAGSWTHVAMVRNGSTVTLYTNGAVRGSFTNSSTVGYSTLTINRFGGGASGQRYLSNVRAVKAAVYTSAFTPPTSPLTSIANTLFLTYQNSTAIDNGPNAFAIGTTGTVTFSTQYPFTLNIASDQSGNGNNWTPINISLANNSTFDSMTDVPTLTSATQANFAVWNSADPSFMIGGSRTISNGNLTAADASTSYGLFAKGTIFVSSGKWYWEYNCTNIGGTTANAGVVRDINNTGVFYQSNGNRNPSAENTGTTAYGASYTTGDIIGVALDMDAGSVTFYKNNSSQGAVTGLSGSYSAGVGDGANGTQATFDVNFGQRPFAYTPPTGFVALNTFNLPTPTIGATASTQAINYMGATTYSGDSTSNRVITTGGGSQFVWIKRRNSTTNHILFDVIRGAGDTLYSNLTNAAVANGSFYVQQFGNTGFTLGTGGDAADNITGGTYVAWNWNAGGSTVTNTSGTISAQVRANTTAGFSIVTYTGNGSAGATWGHGLGVAPNFIIVKGRTNVDNWMTKHSSYPSNLNFIELNTTNALGSATDVWNNTAPTSTVVTVGTGATVNSNGVNYVAYCFSAVAGYSAFGSYTGNGSTDGPFIFTGFRPRYLMVKRTDGGTNNWAIFDTARNPNNATGKELFANLSDAEYNGDVTNPNDLLSNGFKIRHVGTAMNASGATYIYAAFAESPFKYANAR